MLRRCSFSAAGKTSVAGLIVGWADAVQQENTDEHIKTKINVLINVIPQ
jgi:hypothetical protein